MAPAGAALQDCPHETRFRVGRSINIVVSLHFILIRATVLHPIERTSICTTPAGVIRHRPEGTRRGCYEFYCEIGGDADTLDQPQSTITSPAGDGRAHEHRPCEVYSLIAYNA